MKKLEPKWGMIRESMKKHRIRFVIIEIFLIILWIWYLLMCREYITNVFEGAVPLDGARFASEVDTVEVGEPFELHRSDDVSVKDYALRPDSYWQGEKYEFAAELDFAEKSDIKYTNYTTGTGDDSDGDDESANVYFAKINGVDTLIMAYPHQELKSGQTVEGIFTEMPLIVCHDVAKSGYYEPNDTICKYMLDIRGVEMESENFDITFVTVLLLVNLFMAFKIVRQFKNFLYTPTYAQLSKYGNPLEVEKMVESELDDAKFAKNVIITENWIVSEDTFKLKIVKNHMKQGNFRYTPEKF